MSEKERTGAAKKSFELNYHGGSIWCEHLDSMGDLEEEVIGKFWEDCGAFGRPSVSSYMIVNLDETAVTERIAERRRFDRIGTESGAVIRYFADYEKAKEWLLMR